MPQLMTATKKRMMNQQQAAQPGSAPNAQGGFMPRIQTGITVGPVMPQANVDAQVGQMRSFQPQMPNEAGRNYNPMLGHLNALVGGQMNNAATNFGRDASFANAQQMLGTQQARAGAGTGWGSVLLGDYTSQLGNRSQGINALLSLLSQFGGSNAF